MQRRPGGELATRPLHFLWICDCSGSMALDAKIQSLNHAVRTALPQMRTVAEENPNATVLVRTLRFSSGARWIESNPVRLDQYQWTDLVADDVPRTGAFSAEFRHRLEREGAKSGDVQVSLKWHNYNDLDLHVICPSGELIYFSNKRSRCHGELDVDMNVTPTSVEPVENVRWLPGEAPDGHYQVYVHHYRNHGQHGCQDPTAYQVGVLVGGLAQEFQGRISHGEPPQLVYEFDVSAASLQGGGQGNTDLGAALRMVADELRIPPMTDRALPPVMVLLSDGQPTDDFAAGLQALMHQPWGKKGVRIAIGIGQDADLEVLQQFIGHLEIEPLRATNPETLTRYIKWASTAVLKAASAPPSQATASGATNLNVPLPMTPDIDDELASAADVW